LLKWEVKGLEINKLKIIKQVD